MEHKASSVFAEVELLEIVSKKQQRRHKSVSVLGQVSQQNGCHVLELKSSFSLFVYVTLCYPVCYKP